MLSILTIKTESLYCACSPELGVFSYGGCRDEALNNLQDEIEHHRRQDPLSPAEVAAPHAPR